MVSCHCGDNRRPTTEASALRATPRIGISSKRQESGTNVPLSAGVRKRAETIYSAAWDCQRVYPLNLQLQHPNLASGTSHFPSLGEHIRPQHHSHPIHKITSQYA